MAQNGKARPGEAFSPDVRALVPSQGKKRARYGGSSRPRSQRADWALVDAEVLRTAVEAVTVAGDGIILACTSDGGAYAITILTDGEKPRYWPSSPEDCETVLRDITSDARAARDGD